MKARLNHLLILVSIGLGILVLQACKKDTLEIATLETPLLEQAKTYFETQVLAEKAKEQFPSVSKVSPWMRQSLIKQALWEKAYSKKISTGDAVIVPLRYKKSVYTKIGKEKQAVILDNLSYLMIYKTAEGSMSAELVTWIPDDNYWDNRQIKQSEFTGKVIVETWQGKFIKGYSYLGNGKIQPIEIRQTVRKMNTSAVALTSVDCQTTDWYSCVSIDGGENFNCEYDYSETTCYYRYTNLGGSGGGGGGGGSPGGGGTSPGDYSPIAPSPAYKIWIHKIIMTNAATKLQFCPTAINQLALGIEDTDWKTVFGMEYGTSIFHFDGLTNYQAIKRNWELISSGVKVQQDASNYYKLGFLTHAFQDFYAHSNYAELLIEYYGNDLHNVAFSDVLNDNTGQYSGLRQLLESNLKTGTFDLITFIFRNWGASVQGLDYSSTHNSIAKDDADTFAGNYSARLAELETYKILKDVIKCN